MLPVIGLVFLVAGGGLLWLSRQRLQHAATLMATETSTVGALTQLAGEVAAEVGAGSFRQRVELKGTLRSPEPLTGELSRQRCAQVVTRVQRRYEETVERTDSHGTTVRENRTGTETVSELRRVAPALVEDVTGQVPLDLEGASVELTKVVDRFEPHSARVEQDILSLFAHAVGTPGAGRRTLGYQFTEEILPLDRAVFVLGEAVDEGGRLRVRKGPDGLVVSFKSEEQLVGEARSSAKWARVGAVACALAGAGMVLGGLFVK
ncbi:MAG: E3 ubiquitin ligase family protein [Myxococcota bacterium]